MERLIRIINCLRGKEIHFLKSFYKERKENKRLELLNLILEGKVCLNSDACASVCREKHSSTLSQLKKRLRQDLLDIFVLSSFSEIKEEPVKAELECYKSLLLGKILIYKGLTDDGLEVLEKTSEQAGKFELHNIKLACDDVLRAFRSQKTFGNQSHLYNDQIRQSVQSIRNILYAKAINYPFISSKTFSYTSLSGNPNLHELEERSRKSNSRKAVHWYTMAIIHYYIQEDDLLKARHASSNLVKKLKNEPDHTSGYEVTEFYLQFSRILIFLQETEDAIWTAEKALENQDENRSETLPGLEMVFLAYLRSNNLCKAEKIIDTAAKIRNDHMVKLKDVWYLYKASLLFSQKKYRESAKWLVSNENMLNDKSSLKLSSKLFELINILEMEDYEWFEYKLEAYRKRLQRFGAKRIERINLFFRLLIALCKNNYDYNLTAIKEQIILKRFQSSDKAISWDPLGHEVINLAEWFISKTKSQREFKSVMIKV
ncbi:MAG TPA: hypothetical protein VD908_09135 [Cytophagales bacterium]|nr:hypothetical protein [Cytophagales bacterium]